MTPHLCLPGPWPDEESVSLPDQTHHHLTRVLRLDDGAAVTYTDGAGVLGEGALSGQAVARGAETTVPPPRRLEIAVAPPHRTQRARFLVEKLTELGVSRLVWLVTERAQKPPPRKAPAWAIAALEQSRRVWLPEIAGPVAIGDLAGPLAVAHPGEASANWKELVDAGVVFVVGPEGGLTTAELDQLDDRQIALFGLGSATLRTETAALAIAALVGDAQHRSD